MINKIKGKILVQIKLYSSDCHVMIFTLIDRLPLTNIIASDADGVDSCLNLLFKTVASGYKGTPTSIRTVKGFLKRVVHCLLSAIYTE